MTATDGKFNGAAASTRKDVLIALGKALQDKIFSVKQNKDAITNECSDGAQVYGEQLTGNDCVAASALASVTKPTVPELAVEPTRLDVAGLLGAAATALSLPKPQALSALDIDPKTIWSDADDASAPVIKAAAEYGLFTGYPKVDGKCSWKPSDKLVRYELAIVADRVMGLARGSAAGISPGYFADCRSAAEATAKQAQWGEEHPLPDGGLKRDKLEVRGIGTMQEAGSDLRINLEPKPGAITVMGTQITSEEPSTIEFIDGIFTVSLKKGGFSADYQVEQATITFGKTAIDPKVITLAQGGSMAFAPASQGQDRPDEQYRVDGPLSVLLLAPGASFPKTAEQDIAIIPAHGDKPMQLRIYKGKGKVTIGSVEVTFEAGAITNQADLNNKQSSIAATVTDVRGTNVIFAPKSDAVVTEGTGAHTSNAASPPTTVTPGSSTKMTIAMSPQVLTLSDVAQIQPKNVPKIISGLLRFMLLNNNGFDIVAQNNPGATVKLDVTAAVNGVSTDVVEYGPELQALGNALTKELDAEGILPGTTATKTTTPKSLRLKLKDPKSDSIGVVTDALYRGLVARLKDVQGTDAPTSLVTGEATENIVIELYFKANDRDSEKLASYLAKLFDPQTGPYRGIKNTQVRLTQDPDAFKMRIKTDGNANANKLKQLIEKHTDSIATVTVVSDTTNGNYVTIAGLTYNDKTTTQLFKAMLQYLNILDPSLMVESPSAATP